MSSKRGSYDNVTFLRHLLMAKVTNIQKYIKHDIFIKLHENIIKHLKMKMSVMLDTKTQVYHNCSLLGEGMHYTHNAFPFRPRNVKQDTIWNFQFMGFSVTHILQIKA